MPQPGEERGFPRRDGQTVLIYEIEREIRPLEHRFQSARSIELAADRAGPYSPDKGEIEENVEVRLPAELVQHDGGVAGLEIVLSAYVRRFCRGRMQTERGTQEHAQPPCSAAWDRSSTLVPVFFHAT